MTEVKTLEEHLLKVAEQTGFSEGEREGLRLASTIVSNWFAGARPEPTEVERKLRAVVDRLRTDDPDADTILQAADALAAQRADYESSRDELVAQAERFEATMQRAARKLTLLTGSSAVTSAVSESLHDLARMLGGGQ